MKNRYKNIERLKIVANALRSIKNKIVFVGGAVVDLYTNDDSREEMRITDDIDVVVEIINRGDYSVLEEQIRELGFRNDTMSNVICRYTYKGITVDIMPNNENALGFSNKWYNDGVQNSIDFEIEQETFIQIFSVSYFLASKFEALKSERHGNDYRWNSDFEDIVYIFNNRTTIAEDISEADKLVKEYIIAELLQHLKRPYIEEEITSNIEYSNHQFRKDRIMLIWKNLIEKLQ